MTHVGIAFYNLGGYHVARIKAAYEACQQRGWRLTAIQILADDREHPWGIMRSETEFPLRTIVGTCGKRKSIFSNFACQFLKCLRETQPRVLALPGWAEPEWRAGLSWCEKQKVPTILMSETKGDDKKRIWMNEWFKSVWYIKRFHAALVGGALHRDYLVKLGFPKEHVFLGYDAVDNDYFSRRADLTKQNPETARVNQPAIPSRPYFLAVTRLIKRKNIPNLVRAYAHYRRAVDEGEAWDLVICGSGPERGAIQRLIQGEGLDPYVHLPGFITYEWIPDWYGLAKAFVHPALHEPWGLVVNEACASGLPILCSRTVGSASALVKEDQNGLLFDPGSIDEMTHALVTLHRWDSSLSAKGKMSRRIVADYGPRCFAQGFCEAVKVALESP